MDASARLVVASRVTSLAAVVGLALASEDTASLQVAVAVTFIAALGGYLSVASTISGIAALVAEAGLASMVVALTMPESLLTLPYLVTLPLLAGLMAGITGTAAVVAVQMLLVLSLSLVSGELTLLLAQTPVVALWGLAVTAAGLLGAWAKKAGLSTADRVDASYETARRLLLQLRGLSRRLSSGLVPETVATEILEVVHELTLDRASAVLVRIQGGVVVPLAYRGAEVESHIRADDPDIAAALDTGQRRRVDAPGPGPASTTMTVLPLRAGTGMTAAVVTVGRESEPRLPAGLLDDLGLRLEAALAFDDVRTSVTTDERRRLAREIHDGVAQDVASLGYGIDNVRDLTQDTDVTAALDELRDEVSRVVTELKLSVFDLRADIGQGIGLGAALSDYLSILGTRSSLTIHLSLAEAPTRLPAPVEAELFRIVQEAVHNARKHSGARNLWVTCRVSPPEATVEVTDDGRGFDYESPRHGSFGLRTMRERADKIGAELSIGPRHDEAPGTRVAATLARPESDVDVVGTMAAEPTARAAR